MKKIILIVLVILLLGGGGFFMKNRAPDSGPKAPPVMSYTACTDTATTTGPAQYLMFQLFTDITTKELNNNFPPPEGGLSEQVQGIANDVGSIGCKSRKLGFVVGPIAFDHSDEEVRALIQDSFAVALANNVAVGFHIDDSMFWGRLSELNTTENIEWLDWNKTPNTGRRVDWSADPTKVQPQLCINSPAVTAEIKKRAALIGKEVMRGVTSLEAAGKPELFAGVIAGWETQIGKDFETGKSVGYCALTNKGYSAAKPPRDLDQARVDISEEFINLWTSSIAAAGVPEKKIFSHIAVMPQITSEAELQKLTHFESINFTPTSIAFGPHHYPGFSTYPGTEHREQIKAERAKNGNPPWISGEGTALDPALAALGDIGEPMEPYLASFYNDGAVMVNVFGWGVGPRDNAFRLAAENESAIKAYQKFLSGAVLSEVVPEGAKMSLPDRMHKIQELMPTWMEEHSLFQRLGVIARMLKISLYLKLGYLKGVDSTADAMLEILTQ